MQDTPCIGTYALAIDDDDDEYNWYNYRNSVWLVDAFVECATAGWLKQFQWTDIGVSNWYGKMKKKWIAYTT